MSRSVHVRLFAVAVLVAVCAIAATAWLATQLTRASMVREHGADLAADNQVYAELLSYAVEHRDWSEVRGLVEQIVGQRPGRRVTLIGQDGRTIVDVGGSGQLPTTPTAVVDPLAVDPVLVPDPPDDRIDERVLGPYGTPHYARDDHRAHTLVCLRWNRKNPGRTEDCRERQLPLDTVADLRALLDLEDLVDPCLARHELPAVELNPYFDPTREQTTGLSVSDDSAVAECVTAARREQLASYVPPPAMLYLTASSGAPTAAFQVSGNGGQVAGAAMAVLLVTMGVTAFAGARLTRPLRALTTAAEHLSSGRDVPPVQVGGRDEVAKLAKAFNTMAARRAELEHARKALVNDIAHELRTPLSNIRGWLEAAEDGVSDRGPALTGLLLKEALVLQHVVDDLQDLAVADAGELRLKVSPVLLAPLFHQVLSAHRARAERAGVVLVADVAPDLVVEADPLRLKQILDNLVGNAIRYVPSGGSVALRGVHDEDAVVIAVADTGHGIAEEDLPHVFDRFWRADRSRARSTGGSGLGLAIVHRLAEAHGGSVSVRSAVGLGTTFSVRLPAVPA